MKFAFIWSRPNHQPSFASIMQGLCVFCLLLILPAVSWAACSNPSGSAGKMIYNTDESMAQYCDGTNWIAMGRDTSAQIPSNGLIGHWTLDETSGSTIFDNSGNGYNMTWYDYVDNDVADNSQPGKIGTSLSFDEVDNEIILSPASDFNMGTRDWSVSAWIKVDYCTNFSGGIVSKRTNDAGYDGYGLRVQCGSGNALMATLGAAAASTYSATGTTDVLDSQWHHVAAVWDRDGNMSVYLDGALEAATDISSESSYDVQDAVNFHIGSLSTASTSMGGLIDDVRVYNRALTVAEINTLADISLDSGLVGHWKLDETSGTTAADSSGNGNNGTMNGGLSGATDSVAGKVGTALDLDGTADDIDITTVADDVSKSGGTVSLWINRHFPDTEYYQSVFYVGSNVSNGLSIYYYMDDDHWYFQHLGNGTNKNYGTPASTIPQNTWTHLTMTWGDAGGDLKAYVNGSLIGTATNLAAFSASAFNDATLGGNYNQCPSGCEFDGVIDDVRVYDRVLSEYEISQMYCLDIPGRVDYNADDHVMQFCADQGFHAMGPEPYVPNAVFCDGTNDYLMRGAGLTDAADSKKFTMSLWFRKNVSGTLGVMLSGESASFFAQTEANNKVRVKAKNASNADILNLLTSTTITDNEWHHLLVSADLDTPGSARLYIDDTDVTDVITFDGSSGDIDFTMSEFAICSDSGAASLFNGDLADIWVAQGVYTDLSVEANRRKFIDAGGHPVRPWGTPTIMLTGDTADWHTNKGTGGGFSETGALTDAAAAPSGEERNSLSGLVGWWKMNEASGTNVIDASGNGNNGTMTNMDPATDRIAGKIGGALDFGGVDELVSAGSNASIDNIFAGGGTAAAWIYPTDWGENSFGRIFDKASTTAAGDDGWGFFVDNNATLPEVRTLAFRRDYSSSIGTWATPTDTIALNEWQHVAVVFDEDSDANMPVIYVNGKQVSVEEKVDSSGTPTSDAAENLGIGNNATYTNRTFEGYIDDARLYNRALSQNEIKVLYTNAACTSPVGPAGAMIYNTVNNAMQYCNGREWVAVGK